MAKYHGKAYEKIDKDTLQIRIDYGYLDYSINIFDLVQRLDIKLVKYSELSKNQRQFIGSNNALHDGFTIIKKSELSYFFTIYYNDCMPTERQIFTIAHEIKHVVYLEEKPTEKDEALADHFARVLLAPHVL